MVYLIYGNQTPSIKKQMMKIVSSILPEKDEMNFVRYDGSNSLIQEAVDESNYLPLGYDHKVIAVENCYFLEKPKPKNKIESEQDYNSLIDFINHPSEECDLILTVSTSSLDEKNEIYKLIREKGKTVEIMDPKEEEWPLIVKKYVETSLGVKIYPDAVQELASRTIGDMALLITSAQKLALYTDEIKYEDVILMVARPLEDNTFAMFNYLIKDQNDRALALYRDLRVNNVEPVNLISMLAGQFRLLSQVQFLAKKCYSNDEIAKELAIKPVRVQILKKNIASISEAAINRTLEDLFNLDLQIKSGLVDRFYSFELFLINFKRN